MSTSSGKTTKKRTTPRTSKRSTENVAKRFKFGMEFELITLDEKGYVTDGAERLIKRVQEAAPQVDIVKELAKHMIEIRSLPREDLSDIMLKTMEDFEAVLFAAEKEKLLLYPFGTYPGTYTPEFTKGKRFKTMTEVFGPQRLAMFARCFGLHCHFTLPRGVFDSAKKALKHLINSKNKESLVNIYNLYLAMDPAMTTFAQSSPFYQGKLLGKDSRIIVTRGGEALNYPQGLFANYPEFGELQVYDHTAADLIQGITRRFDEFAKLIKKVGMQVKVFSKYGSTLDVSWNPVRVSAHGTMEQRSMDMNMPRVVIAVALITKYISRLVQEQYVQVIPSDIGIAEPFKYDEKEKAIYIPPDSHVRLTLQGQAAWKGLESDEIHQYCSGLLKLAKTAIPADRHSLLEPLETMLKDRKTTADKIIKEAQEFGFDVKEGLTNAQAAELAADIAKSLYKEIILMKQTLQELKEE